MKTPPQSIGVVITVSVAVAACLTVLGWRLLCGTDSSNIPADAPHAVVPAGSEPDPALASDRRPATTAIEKSEGIDRLPFREGAAALQEPTDPRAPVRRFDVRVIDGAGKPAGGVPVTLVHGESGFRGQDQVAIDARASGRTAADGTATLSAPTTPSSGRPPSDALRPDFGFPYLRTTPPPKPGSDGFTVLQIPECGRVRIEVVDEHDVPISSFCRIIVVPENDGEAIGGSPLKFEPRASEATPSESPIGLGLDFTASVRARVPGVGSGFCRQTFRGPTKPGEVVSVRVPIYSLRREIGARLQWTDGKPAANHRVLVARVWESETPEVEANLLQLEGRTDGEGFVTIDVDDKHGALEGALLAFSVSDPPDRWIARKRVGTVDAGDLGELGVLTLVRDQPLVAGSVFAADGLVVDGARVDVSFPGDEAAAALPGDAESFLNRRLRQFAVDYDSDSGAFAVFGPGALRPLVLTASAPGCSSSRTATKTVKIGSRDVRLTLGDAPGVVEGSVALGELDERDISIAVTASGLPPNGASCDVSVSDDGSFATTPLPPGSYDVSVVLGPREFWAPTAVVVSGVMVKSRETNSDPRLRDIDLDGKFRRVTLTVVDKAGEPVRRPTAEVLNSKRRAADGVRSTPRDASAASGDAEAGARGAPSAQKDRAPGAQTPAKRAPYAKARRGPEPGLVSLLLTDAECTIRIADDGDPRPKYRPVVLHNVVEDAGVTLLPRPRVRLETVDDETSSEFDARLVPRLRVMHDDGTEATNDKAWSEFSEAILVPEPGDYVVEWTVDVGWSLRDFNGVVRSSTTLTGNLPTTVVKVADLDVEQVITVTPPAAALEAARKMFSRTSR